MGWFADKVWFTYKARIQASERLENNNFHSQLLLVWYALFTTAISITAIRHPKLLGNNTDIALAILSVSLLVITLLVTNCDFRGKSLRMRENYLAMQHLYNKIKLDNSTEPTNEILEEYSTLLQQCENHLEIDDIIWRVQSQQGTSREVSPQEKCTFHSHKLKKLLCLSILYILPIAITFLAKNLV